MTEPLPITGERTVPGVPSENYWFQRHVAAYRFAAKLVDGTVLDAGCGEGYGAAILSRTADRVIALDLDEPTLDHVRSKYRQLSPARADLTDLPFAAGSLDGIVSLQVLEHLPDADAFLAACARVLSPGGRLILSTPNVATFPAGLNPFHTHEYDAAELRELLRGRFSDVRFFGLTHGIGLRLLELAIGEGIQDRLIRTPFPELSPWLRVKLRAVRAGSFKVTTDPSGSLDLLSVCRNTPSGA